LCYDYRVVRESMKNERIKLIIKNIELLLEQLKLECIDDEPEVPPSNLIHIKDLITKDDYEDPDYYEEPDRNLPNVSVRWRNDDV
jgi:hypothetical protein